MIRAARPEEAERLREIESAAGEQFAGVGLEIVATAEPLSAPLLAAFAAAGSCWVAVDVGDRPVGYAIAEQVDGTCAHVEQVSVEPRFQGRGLGRQLIDTVESWGRQRRLLWLTLTTFRDVPWNRPLYERLGFVVMTEDEIGPGLGAIRRIEAAQGLDPAQRVCMRRPIGPGPPG